MISFMLNNQTQVIDDIDPNTTVLDYLREHLHLTGTKEGCASGDCGACTVVLAEPNESANNKASASKALSYKALSYKAVNACITPIGHVQGKQLITVEHLKHQNKLHPVQQVMVDNHGSQCGFCTPGFVMSLFAYRKSHQQADHESIIEALGGNLCRCTGYRPIIDAAVQMFDPKKYNINDQFTENEEDVYQQLVHLHQQSSNIKISADNKHYFAPQSCDELATLLMMYPKARLVAGATDLGLELTQLLKEIDCLIYTGHVNSLKEITINDNVLSLGAAVTFNQAKETLVNHYPDLKELIERLGSFQIRNQATIAGNIANASPIGDFPPVLIALGASVQLRQGKQRRTIKVEDYFKHYKVTALQESEFIEHILIPVNQNNIEFKVYKISKRLEDDISATCGAFSLCISKNEQGQERVTEAKIAFGGMAEIPKRAIHCEKALINQQWSLTTIENAMQALAEDFSPISDFRASQDYRLQVSKNLIKRFYLERLHTNKSPTSVTSDIKVRFTHA